MINPYLTTTVILLLLLACKNSPEKPATNKTNAIATIDSTEITLPEVDAQIQQQLYDQLYQVYLFRKRALETVIEQRLLEQYAAKRNMSVDSLVSSYITTKHIEKAVAEFDSTKKGVVDIKRTLNYVSAHTEEGRKLIRLKLIELAKKHIVDSLKKTVNINIRLQPPVSPEFNNSNVDVTWLPQTNLNSNKEIVLVSDFECEHCRKVHSVFSKLIDKYKSKYKFGIIPYGSYTTLYLTTCEVMKTHNKFWETYDYLMKQPNFFDTAQIVQFVAQQKVDITAFREALHSETLRQHLTKQFQKVKEKGINATPSLLINGKLIYNAFSEEELEKAINAD